MRNDNGSPETLRLRRQAEVRLREKTLAAPGPPTPDEMLRMHHELQVHQIELELQHEELRRSKDEANEVLESYIDLYDFAPVGYLTLDDKGTIRAANLTGATLLGEDRSRLIGRPFRFFLTSAQPPLPDFLEGVFAGKGKEYCEATLRPGMNPARYVRIEALAVASGHECRAAIIDVTELRQKDFLLISQNRLAAMGEMINNIAHQWRKPLNTLGLTIQQILLDHEQGSLSREPLEEAVGKSMELIKHMSQTIEDFKNYFKPDQEKVNFKIHDVLARALFLLEENCNKQRIAVKVVDEEGIRVLGYPNEFLQVLINILVNAIDALTEKAVAAPRITITIGREAKGAVVTIADNAGGISEEIIGQIFDPYISTKEAGKGTGIGLYLSKTIIEKMDGSLTARNIPEGAEFRIEI